MKVSFKNIVYYPTLDGKTEKCEDFTAAIAEAVYQNAANFNEHTLAHHIADTKGEMELSAAEAAVIKRAISQWRFFIQKPILEMLGEKFERI